VTDAEPAERLLERLFRSTRGGAPRDPRRTRRLLDRLNLPDLPLVVHVVGTNGKGGVATRIDAGLNAAGFRSLRFLSPHVERFHERIAIAGAEVTDDEIVRFLQRAWRDEPDPPAAFFELALAMALAVAEERGADAAVLEAGVGAARDATIAVGAVRVSVITNVAEEHLEQIGPTLADVTRDKAAAIRPGVPVVTGAEGEPLEIVRRLASERASPLLSLSSGVAPFAWPAGAPPSESTVADRAGRLAIAALRTLDLDTATEHAALLAAATPPALPARRERFELGRGRCILLDGAHEPNAARALAAELPSSAELLLGVAERKNARGVLDAFAEVHEVTLTCAVRGERPWGDHPAFIADPEAALAHALESLPEGATLVVTGSFYLAGLLRPRIRALAGAAIR